MPLKILIYYLHMQHCEFFNAVHLESSEFLEAP
jgi:hypothetical protein